MTLLKFEKSIMGHENIYHLKTQKQQPEEKRVWSEEMIVNCDVICGADKSLRKYCP